MSIDLLLAYVRLTRSILVSESEIWLNQNVAQDIEKDMRRGLRKHRRGIRLLLTWSDYAICPNPDLHRRYYRYEGLGRFICGKCEELQPFLYKGA